MADSRNIIEFIFRAVDQLSAPLGKMAGAVRGVFGALTSVRGLLAGAGLALSFRALARNITESQEANLQLANALQLAGKNAGVTAAGIVAYATQLQRVTTFSDEAAKQSATLALRLGLTGDTIKRTVTAAADLAAATGGQLTSSVQQLARALANPERGMLALRRSGVMLSASQRSLIQDFTAVGDKARAQDVLLKAVEDRYRGAAAAATQTLGGALKQLSNTVGALFEGGDTKGLTSLTGAINDMSKALADPSIKEGLDSLIGGLATIATLAVKSAAAIGNLFAALKHGMDNTTNDFKETVGFFEKVKLFFDNIKVGGGAMAAAFHLADTMRGTGSAAPAPVPASAVVTVEDLGLVNEEQQAILDDFFRNELPTLTQESFETMGEASRAYYDSEEARIADFATVQREAVRANTVATASFYDALNAATRTSAEQRAVELEEFRTSLQLLQAAGLISEETARQRLAEFGTRVVTVADQIKAAMEGAAQSIQASMAQAFRFDGSGRDFLRNFIDAIRNAMAEVLAIIAVNVLGINKLLASIGNAMTTTGGGSSGSGFGLGDAIKVLGSLVLGRATGGMAEAGQFYRTAEEGGELILPRKAAYILSNRKLLSMLGGGADSGPVFAPVTTVTLQTGGEAERAALAAEMERRDARIMRAWMEVMRANGYRMV